MAHYPDMSFEDDLQQVYLAESAILSFRYLDILRLRIFAN